MIRALLLATLMTAAAAVAEEPTRVDRADYLAVENARLAYELSQAQFRLKYRLEEGDAIDFKSWTIKRAPKPAPAKK